MPRRSLSIGIASLAVAVFVLAVPSPARAAGGSASIVGTVEVEAGDIYPTPVEGACATATETTTSATATACSDASGGYVIEGLDAGSYIVKVTAAGYLDQWVTGSPSDPQLNVAGAEPITVAEGQTSNPYMLLVSGTAVTGQVRSGGDLVANQPFCVSAMSGSTVVAYDCPRDWLPGTFNLTAADGLVPGQYTLAFSGNGDYGANAGPYAPQWYPGGIVDQADATAVTVTAGGLLRADLAVTLGGVITGTVTAADTGLPLGTDSLASFFAYSLDDRTYALPPGFGPDAFLARMHSRSFVNGVYRLEGLPAGSYKVHFDGYDGPFFEEWYADAPDEATATPVSVTAGGTTSGIDAALVRGGTITGTLTSATTGLPLDNTQVYVDAYDANGEYHFGDYKIGSDGVFHVYKLTTGNYRLHFVGFRSFSGESQWYDHAADLAHATPVAVTVGQTTANVNQVLFDPPAPPPPPAATAPGAPTGVAATAGDGSGVVSWSAAAANGSPISGYTVTATPGGGSCSTGGALTCTVTGLTNGTSYSFTVQATNGVGTGPTSAASNSVTPAAVPGAPTVGAASAGNTTASVTFTAPVSDGGSPITGYTVTANPGGITAAGSTSPITVTGLTNGTAYTFTVKATNAVGPGPASAASNSVTPRAASVPTFRLGTNVIAAGQFTKVVVNGAPGDSIQVLVKGAASSTYTVIGTLTPNSAGVAALTISPSTTSSYFVRNAVGPTATKSLLVKAVQTLAVSARGRTGTFAGHVAPSLFGRNVTVYYYVTGGHVQVACRTLVVSGGNFRCTKAFPAGLKINAFAQTAADSYNAAGRSPLKTLTLGR